MPKKLSSIQDFLFSAPLYAEYDLALPEEDRSSLAWELFSKPLVADGHCIDCGRVSTFRRTSPKLDYEDITRIEKYVASVRMVITCARDLGHEINFVFRANNLIIQKIGQYPSLADITNDESRSYRQVLEQYDSAELHRAIGLAAHGVGVGSFVYLRRVFQRLITRRFNEFKDTEGWTADDFVGKRIEDQITLLQQHLPDFLVRNKKVYAILSKGIHELEEETCLNAFEMLKQAIFFILDEDKHKKEELERRQAAEKAIAAFNR